MSYNKWMVIASKYLGLAGIFLLIIVVVGQAYVPELYVITVGLLITAGALYSLYWLLNRQAKFVSQKDADEKADMQEKVRQWQFASVQQLSPELLTSLMKSDWKGLASAFIRLPQQQRSIVWEICKEFWGGKAPAGTQPIEYFIFDHRALLEYEAMQGGTMAGHILAVIWNIPILEEVVPWHPLVRDLLTVYKAHSENEFVRRLVKSRLRNRLPSKMSNDLDQLLQAHLEKDSSTLITVFGKYLDDEQCRNTVTWFTQFDPVQEMVNVVETKDFTSLIVSLSDHDAGHALRTEMVGALTKYTPQELNQIFCAHFGETIVSHLVQASQLKGLSSQLRIAFLTQLVDFRRERVLGK